MTFVDLEKAFDRVPQKHILVGAEKTWCGVDCETGAGDVCQCVEPGRGTVKSEVKVSVHHGSVFSLLLFIIVLEALSREFCSGVPWEDLYADDLVIIAESRNVLGGS